MSTLELGAQQPKGHTAVVACPPLSRCRLGSACLSLGERERAP